MMYSFNNETIVLVMSGTGTINLRSDYRNATHITVEEFTALNDLNIILNHVLNDII